jgi:hypothetical protein
MKALREYFIRNVVGDFETYRANRRDGAFGLGVDTKLALYASLSQLHLMDHVLLAFKGDIASLRETSLTSLSARLQRQTPEFKLVCDCGNALKHYRLDRNQPIIEGLRSIKDHPAVIRRMDEGGAYYVTDKPVFAVLLDGRRIDLGANLLSGLKMWSEELVRLRVIPKVPKIATEPLVLHSPVTDRREVTLKMVAMVGEAFNERPLFFVHDEALGQYREASLQDSFDVNIKVAAEVSESLF